MKRAISSAAQVRALDSAVIKGFGVPGTALMELAARGVAEEVRRRVSAGSRVGVACGPGNNGGDGWATARWLAGWGYSVEVVYLPAPTPPMSDAAVMRRAAERAAIPSREWTGVLPGAALWIDALFGTGLARPLDGPPAQLIASMQASGAPIVAVDLPSGLHADTGAVLGAAPRCAATVSFGRYKPGMFSGEGPKLCGAVTIVDIGLDIAPGAADRRVADLGDVDAPPCAVPRRTEASHKRSSGHLLVVAGSVEMAGAAVLCCRGALAGGAGLVTLAVPTGALPRLAALPPEVMVVGRDALPDPGRYSAIAAGPGLSGGEVLDPALAAWLTAVWRHAPVPAVFDADALASCAPGSPTGRVLTPHPGEAARMLGIPRVEDRFAAAASLAERGVSLLKGHHTVICQKGLPMWVNPTGGPALATGGSGDVLTGLVGALLGRGLSSWDAARLAAWAHGRAGDRLAARGHSEPLASELPAEIAQVLESARSER